MKSYLIFPNQLRYIAYIQCKQLHTMWANLFLNATTISLTRRCTNMQCPLRDVTWQFQSIYRMYDGIVIRHMWEMTYSLRACHGLE